MKRKDQQRGLSSGELQKISDSFGYINYYLYFCALHFMKTTELL